MAFAIKKVVDLTEFGWEGCSLTFNSLSYEELLNLQGRFSNVDPSRTDKAADEVLGILGSKFVSGTALDEKDQKVDVSKEDLGKFPFEIIERVTETLTRSNPDPKL